MKKLGGILIIVFMLLLNGCGDSKNQEMSKYDELMSKAVSSILSDDYEGAKKYLQDALSEAPNDSEAKGLIEGLDIIMSISEEPKNIYEVISKIEESEKLKSINITSTSVDDKINKKVEELLELFSKTMDNIEDDIKNGDSKKFEKILNKILSRLEDSKELFNSQITRCEELLKKCKELNKDSDKDTNKNKSNSNSNNNYDYYDYYTDEEEDYNNYYDEEEDYYTEDEEDYYYDEEEDYSGEDDEYYYEEDFYGEDSYYYDEEEPVIEEEEEVVY